jgi:crotonobetainyl-CoA:carnitine CoA-transferase CaiB-like acyl-CoA transferase
MSPDANGTAPLPLAGLRVLELGQLIAGPFCGQLLADLGAEVIKIELPGAGDPMREWGRGLAVWWPIIARNKKCITLDVRGERGLAIARRLVAVADVVLENFRPGTMEKWGLGWMDLAAINRGIVMVRVSGFGQDGPYAGRAGYGGIGEAMGGLRQVCGDPKTPPSRVGISIGDSLAALFACIGCLAALRHRDLSGRGQVVDSAIYESVLGVMESTVPEFTQGGLVRERTGSILPGLAPSNVYPTADGRMVLIGANQDSVFRRLCGAMRRPELAADPGFATHRARGDNQQALDEMIAEWTATLPEDELLRLLETSGVPAGRIFRAPDMLDDPQYRARRSVVRVPHPEFGKLWMQNVFPRFSETAGAIRWPGPALGAHNDEIYGELLGMDGAERRQLAAAGVI